MYGYSLFFHRRRANGTLDSRLLEITHQGLNPRTPTPTQEEEPADEQQTPIGTESDVVVTGVPAIPTSGGFHFMQESELETPSFEENIQWADQTAVRESATPQVNGHSHSEQVVAPGVRLCVFSFKASNSLYTFRHQSPQSLTIGQQMTR